MSVDSLMTAICGIDPSLTIGLVVAKPSRRARSNGHLGHHALCLGGARRCVKSLTLTVKSFVLSARWQAVLRRSRTSIRILPQALGRSADLGEHFGFEKPLDHQHK